MLQQIILLLFAQSEQIWKGQKVAISTVEEQCRGKEETQILLLATGPSTQNVQAATKREARHLTSDEHRDIFSSVVQSVIFKCIAIGKSLAERSEKPFRNL